MAVAPYLITPGFSPVALGESPTTVYPLPVRTTTAHVDGDLEMAVLNLVNEERVAAGLVPLMPHASIQTAARNHGREMFAWGYLSHRSRDGRMPRDRVLGLGVRVRLIGENLAYAADARSAHEALMASQAHRRNVLFPAYRLVGIGVVDGGEDGVIVVEDFSDDGILYHLPRWWEKPAAGRR
jgi:uncharacterized protein YkwD